MAAPLRSANPSPAKDVQFKHFGVLDTGGQSKASTITSLTVNLMLAFIAVVISAAAAKQTMEHNKMLTTLVVPVTEKKPEPPKPKVVPPKIKPLPQLVKIEQPKIKLPEIKTPEAPKQPLVKMDTPKPVLLPTPAPPKVVAMAAPVAVNLGRPQAASVPNNDAHPSAVRLGNPDSPVPNLHGPAVASVNLARGMPGMNPGNNGNGPRATTVVMGNGSPESTSIKGNGVQAVAGIPHGTPGGTGTGPGRPAGQVNLGQNTPPPAPKPAAVAPTAQGKPAKVLYKPKPEYTQEAIRLHLEGVVDVRIRVEANGSVQVLGITNSLGHGLDESAERAVMATKFEPATDASGRPVDWDGVVRITFQLAG